MDKINISEYEKKFIEMMLKTLNKRYLDLKNSVYFDRYEYFSYLLEDKDIQIDLKELATSLANFTEDEIEDIGPYILLNSIGNSVTQETIEEAMISFKLNYIPHWKIQYIVFRDMCEIIEKNQGTTHFTDIRDKRVEIKYDYFQSVKDLAREFVEQISILIKSKEPIPSSLENWEEVLSNFVCIEVDENITVNDNKLLEELLELDDEDLKFEEDFLVEN